MYGALAPPLKNQELPFIPPCLYDRFNSIQIDDIMVVITASIIAQNSGRECRHVLSIIFNPFAAEAMTNVRMSADQTYVWAIAVSPSTPSDRAAKAGNRKA
ncbi:TPA: hypothetical protein EYM26_16600 [Candidatus Poribacteria bacterium]|nr:hypothetical protein [Candidatus Poribacteria bacterium]